MTGGADEAVRVKGLVHRLNQIFQNGAAAARAFRREELLVMRAAVNRVLPSGIWLLEKGGEIKEESNQSEQYLADFSVVDAADEVFGMPDAAQRGDRFTDYCTVASRALALALCVDTLNFF